jgi:phosphatidylinositol glycan class B
MWKTNLLCVFLVTRLSSVFVVQTWFVPDEYWQSLEVSHRLSFGYGYLTWEWLEGIRSLIYPFLFFIPYKLLAYFSLDNPKALV